MIEAAPDFIALLDADGTIRYMNGHSSSGTSPKDIVGTHLSQWFPPSSYSVLECALHEAIGSGDTIEFTVPDPDGLMTHTPVLIRLRFNPVQGEHQVKSIVGFGWFESMAGAQQGDHGGSSAIEETPGVDGVEASPGA